MTLNTPRPPYDPEIQSSFEAIRSTMPPLTTESLKALRHSLSTDISDLLLAREIKMDNVVIPGHHGEDIELSVLSKGNASTGPVIYHSHGGGMILGDRWSGIASFLDWIDLYDAAIVTVEYRLAPDFPDPHPREDAYAGLVWTADHAHEHGIDARRIIVAGQSAGGGIAAGLALMARDRNGPKILGQILLSPMLDDRNCTVSAHQFDGTGGWDRQANIFGWNALLGEGCAAKKISAYAAPSRMEDLTNLPPTFLECGTAEIFRDEVVEYAKKLWNAGNHAELHMWAGGFHRYDLLVPESLIAANTVESRTAWMTRLLRE